MSGSEVSLTTSIKRMKSLLSISLHVSKNTAIQRVVKSWLAQRWLSMLPDRNSASEHSDRQGLGTDWRLANPQWLFGISHGRAKINRE